MSDNQTFVGGLLNGEERFMRELDYFFRKAHLNAEDLQSINVGNQFSTRVSNDGSKQYVLDKEAYISIMMKNREHYELIWNRETHYLYARR